MKKKMLIIGITMPIAGIEKSFIEFSKNIDYEKWDVELLLAKKEGELLSEVPSNIIISDMGEYGDIFTLNRYNSKEVIKKVFIKNNFFNYFKILPNVISIIFSKNEKKTYNKHKLWLKIMDIMPVNDKQYDIAIDYWGDRTMFYLSNKVKNANKKISWMHFDYFYHNRDNQTYKLAIENIDTLVCVNNDIKEKMQNEFSMFKDKFVYLDNYIDIENILKKSVEEIELDIDKDKSIITVGRLEKDKGYDLFLKTFSSVTKKDDKIIWYIIGNDNTEYAKWFKKQICEFKLENNIVFLGEQKNPYKYISKCGLYVQPSRTEASPIAIREAIIIGNNITASDISNIRKTIEEVVINKENVVLVDFDNDNSDVVLSLLKSNCKIEYNIKTNVDYSNKVQQLLN